MECQAVRQLAEEFPGLRFAWNTSPRNANPFLPGANGGHVAAARRPAAPTWRHHRYGHAFVAGEVVAESVVLAKRAGTGSSTCTLTTITVMDDDMIVVPSTAWLLEMLYWLDRCGYSGWFSMDQYPYREDAAGALGEHLAAGQVRRHPAADAGQNRPAPAARRRRSHSADHPRRVIEEDRG